MTAEDPKACTSDDVADPVAVVEETP
jgi:hypothetical protein